jgi:hypothetical protein
MESYESLSIKKLAEVVRKNGFEYKLVQRTNERCIYSQHSKMGRIIGYELFFTKLGDQHKAKQRWATLHNKDLNLDELEKYYEIFPGDEEFGKRAWTFVKLEDAQKAFDSK